MKKGQFNWRRDDRRTVLTSTEEPHFSLCRAINFIVYCIVIAMNIGGIVKP
jgi:hypothetical protein